jgi:hypothetical protein
MNEKLILNLLGASLSPSVASAPLSHPAVDKKPLQKNGQLFFGLKPIFRAFYQPRPGFSSAQPPARVSKTLN